LAAKKSEVKANRKTSETNVTVELTLNGSGKSEVSTGIRFFDHMLSALARHGRFDIKISAKEVTKVDAHHVIEDVGLVLGTALRDALPGKEIVRFGWAVVPMDEARATVTVDMGGRPFASLDAGFFSEDVGDMPTDMVEHFLWSLASTAKMNVHAVLTGENDHHQVEAMFKALAMALRRATSPDTGAGIPSTKGTI
jgi:imidazoleglycerol-phosphate dehydratase